MTTMAAAIAALVAMVLSQGRQPPRIIPIGNSRGVRIPKPLLEQTGLRGEVEITAEDGSLVIRPVKKPRDGWASAFQEMARRGQSVLVLALFLGGPEAQGKAGLTATSLEQFVYDLGESASVDGFPAGPGRTERIRFERVEIYGPDAHLYIVDARGQTEIPRSPRLYFRGYSEDGATRIALSDSQFAILVHLVSHVGEVVSKEKRWVELVKLPPEFDTNRLDESVPVERPPKDEPWMSITSFEVLKSTM